MLYRDLGNTGYQVSEIGLGCEHLQGMAYEQIEAVVEEAIAQGINIFDIFMSEPNVRSDLGKALQGQRNKVLLQGHIGSAWLNDQYCRTRKPDESKFFFEDFMARLQTDYVDIGMLHYIDAMDDFERVFDTSVLQYALELKEQGVIKMLGMSSHNPSVALRAVNTGLLDVLMFSINPAYDIMPDNTDVHDLFEKDNYSDSLSGIDPARAELYRACEARGVAITVMKTLAAGKLLRAETSPFGVAMSESQCIHYALTRPGVKSVLIGCRTPEEVRAAVCYEQAGEKERDYSTVLSNTPRYSMKGSCMYCNHCLPCPADINIAEVNKFLDLATVEGQPPMSVTAHYHSLKHHAGECIGCRSCEKNCPFDVHVVERMQQAKKLFGR